MDNEFEDKLSPHERRTLDRLAKEKTPPKFLEERIVEMLKESNLIRSSWSSRLPGSTRLVAAFGACLIFFVLGILVGAWRASMPAHEATIPEFLLVLRTAPQQSQDETSEEALQKFKEYGAWARSIQQIGLLLGGEELKRETRVIRVIDGRAAVSKNEPETMDSVIAGYFLIRANDYDRAAAIAESCPHLKYGGAIEIRQIERR